MRTSMHQPKGMLAEVLHGIGFMSTLDEAWPLAQPHLNRFPAMVYCSITLILNGAVALPAEEGGARALSGLLVSGPRTRPVTSVSLAPVRSLSAILYPDAFHLLAQELGRADLAGLIAGATAPATQARSRQVAKAMAKEDGIAAAIGAMLGGAARVPLP